MPFLAEKEKKRRAEHAAFLAEARWQAEADAKAAKEAMRRQKTEERLRAKEERAQAKAEKLALEWKNKVAREQAKVEKKEGRGSGKGPAANEGSKAGGEVAEEAPPAGNPLAQMFESISLALSSTKAGGNEAGTAAVGQAKKEAEEAPPPSSPLGQLVSGIGHGIGGILRAPTALSQTLSCAPVARAPARQDPRNPRLAPSTTANGGSKQPPAKSPSSKVAPVPQNGGAVANGEATASPRRLSFDGLRRRPSVEWL